jgi:large subunit ribosomal protein L25
VSEARIAAETRTEFGKGAARRTRRAGKIPAVLYGHGTEPQHVALPSIEFARVVREQGRNAVLTLDIDGTPQLALTKTVVVHPVRPYIEHVDLLVITRGEKVSVEVQIVVTGDPVPGSLVNQELNLVEIAADVSSIPESVEVSVEDVAIGTQILAGQLQLPQGSTLVSDPELLVINVVAATDADVESDADGTTDSAPAAEAAAPAAQAESGSSEG